MTDSFCLGGYHALIQALFSENYAVVDFGNVNPEKRHLVLRHDVDISLEAAVAIAEIEADLGASAWYFVLLRTEMYNLWSGDNIKHLRYLLALGHRVGLHFDAALYSQDDAILDDAAERECVVLETALNEPVEMISFHRPAPTLLNQDRPIGSRRHTYEPYFFSELGYCSDSRGRWSHGHPLDHPVLAQGRALQLLTHPIWWAREIPLDPVAVLDDFRRRRDEALGQAIADNCDPYREALAAR